MLADLLDGLSHGLTGSSGWAVLAAFAWGVASLVLSPCHLTGIPLLVAFINGGPPVSTRRASQLALGFGVGLLIAIGVAGLVAVALGRMAGDVGPWTTYVVAGLLAAAGLSLLDVLPVSWSLPDVTRWRGRGSTGALALGLIFGVALGPCTFAYLTPVLAVAFRAGRDTSAAGALLVLAFALGHCLLIVLAGTMAGRVHQLVAASDEGRHLLHLRHASGVLVLIGALYLVYVS